MASDRFTPAYLYALNKCRLDAINDPSSVTTTEYWQRHIRARNEFVNENDEVKDLWQMKSRQHIHRQPHIAELIISALEKNPRRSWMGLESDIDNWCGATTIRKWLTTTESFSYYAERILPNLLSHQKVKHKEFAERFRMNWGLGAGKYLLIEFDEKWMWGLVVRRYAKSCKKLGLNKKYFKAFVLMLLVMLLML